MYMIGPATAGVLGFLYSGIVRGSINKHKSSWTVGPRRLG
jgi:hypothetical protein